MRPVDVFNMYGKNRLEVIANKQCMTCETPNLQFLDLISKKEYHITGLCQTCQDETFND